MKRRSFLERASLMSAAGLLATKGGFAAGTTKRPNIMLIMGDDIGFSDLGCFGGEIDTPHLDRLGYGGMRFTQGYNMAKCNPTRSAMMTGTFIGGANCQSLGALMTQAGYTTLTSGKEHYDGWVPERCKAMNSYERSFTHYGGAGPFFEYKAVKFHLDRKPISIEEIKKHTSEPYYKTNVITDFALKFLDEEPQKDKPFFLYVAYESAHYPIHTLQEDFDKYKDKYDTTYDALRKARYAKQQKLGVLEPGAKLSPIVGEGKLTDEEQEVQAGFAGMVHCLDRNIGRLLGKLEEMGELENTLIIYLSDNGSCPFVKGKNKDHPTNPESYRFVNPAMANLGDTPFRMYKQDGQEGGSKTHLLAHWPAVIKPGSIHRQPAHLVDFMPTFLEIAGTQYPAEFEGKPTPLLDGLSLLPVFQGQQRKPHDILISGWTKKKRMIRQGDWKLVRNGKEWELFNMKDDPSEMNNLVSKMPEKVQYLEKVYADWRGARPYLGESQAGGSKDGEKKVPKKKKKK